MNKAEIHQSEAGFLQVTYPAGKISIEMIREARRRGRTLLQQLQIDHFLLDYRRVDLCGISLIEFDSLALELVQQAPECRKGALVYDKACGAYLMQHVARVFCLTGIDAQMFADFESAESWLCEPEDIG